MAFASLYILDGSNRPVRCSNLESWAKWSRSNAKRKLLALDEAGEATVRTRFLGVDVQVQDDLQPVTFSTEVFLTFDKCKHEHELDSLFYETYDDALAGHAAFVESYKNVAGIIMGDRSAKVDSRSS